MEDIQGAQNLAQHRAQKDPDAIPIIAETTVKLGDLGQIVDLRADGIHRRQWDTFLANHPTLVKLHEHFTTIHKIMEARGKASALTIPKADKPAALFYDIRAQVKREEIVKDFLIEHIGTDKVTIIGDVAPFGGIYTGQSQTAIRSPETLQKMKFKMRTRLRKNA